LFFDGRTSGGDLTPVGKRRSAALFEGRAIDDVAFEVEMVVDVGVDRIAGAMRVAAIDRVQFDVTDFTPAALIRSDPTSLASTYPAVLIPAIRRHATAE
jgi:hypothetical protein